MLRKGHRRADFHSRDCHSYEARLRRGAHCRVLGNTSKGTEQPLGGGSLQSCPMRCFTGAERVSRVVCESATERETRERNQTQWRGPMLGKEAEKGTHSQ